MLDHRRTRFARGWAALCVGAVLLAGGSAYADLPDGRAYELVSPLEKNGGDILVRTDRTRAADDGNAVSFTSLAAFGDIGGTGVASDYIGEREGNPGTSGWTVRGLLPPVEPSHFAVLLVLGVETAYQAMSDDLSVGVLQAFTPLTDDPNVEKLPNLYRNDAVRTGHGGSLALVTDASIPAAPPIDQYPFNLFLPFVRPWFADASPDFEHVAFESGVNLTPEAATLSPFEAKAYKWSGGTVSLQGVLPDDTPAPSSAIGRGVGGSGGHSTFAIDAMSEDGRRVVFKTPAFGTTGQLYLRVDDAVTVHLNASENTGAPGPPQDAEWWASTPDGLQVFFTTAEQLTDDDDNSSVDLYRYDASRPASEPDNLTRMSLNAATGFDPNVRGVVGVSRDGTYVYIVADGDNGIPRLFLWHEGDVRDVAKLNLGPEVIDLLGEQTYNLAPKSGRVTPDGKHLVWVSGGNDEFPDHHHGNVCPGGVGPSFGQVECSHVYLYDADANGGAGRVSCASCSPSGAPATSNADYRFKRNESASTNVPYLNHPLTDDGKRLFFSTGDRLVPEDQNGTKYDVYQYDIETGDLHLLSTGKSTSHSYFMDASASGDDAFFITRERLVGWDTDANQDLYDARVNGGFPEPAPAVGCSGDECQGPSSSRAIASPPASSVIRSAGNVARGQGAARFRVLRLTQAQRATWAKTGRVRLHVRISKRGAVTARVRAKVNGRMQVVASASKTRSAGELALTLRLSRQALGQLEKSGVLRVSIVTRYSRVARVDRVTLRLEAGQS